MADATKTPNFKYFEWSRPSTAPVTLTRGYNAGDTTLYWSAPPLDKAGTIINGGFTVGVQNPDTGDTANFWIPEGEVSGDGLSATNVVLQGRSGTDFDTANATYDVDFPAGSNVGRVVSPVEWQVILNTLQGLIATGGTGLIIGTEPGAGGETITLSRTTTAGTTLGVLRWFITSGKVEFSNDGLGWTAIDDTVSSTLVDVSATDTTPGYLLAKLVAGDNVTITQTNIGGNETLTIAASSQREGVTTHETYTPAFLTGGSNAESNFAVWDNVTDGSFRVTVDGTAYNIDGIDFTGDASMNDVAATIQTALRAITSGDETVVWSTDHFVITSADTTASSEISVLSTSTGTVGTDISGAGASDWMDSDTGNGTATAPVLDPTADVGKVPLLNANGNVDTDLLREVIPTGGYTAKGELVVGTAADTPGLLGVGSNGKAVVADSTEATGLKYKNIDPMGRNIDSAIETAHLAGDFFNAVDTGTETNQGVGAGGALLADTTYSGLFSNIYAPPSNFSANAYQETITIKEIDFFFYFGRVLTSSDSDCSVGVSQGSNDFEKAYNAITNDFAGFVLDGSANTLYAHVTDGVTPASQSVDASFLQEETNHGKIVLNADDDIELWLNGSLVYTYTAGDITIANLAYAGIGTRVNAVTTRIAMMNTVARFTVS